MVQIFEDIKPGDLITSDLFNKMAGKIEELFERVAAIERTATGSISGMVKDIETGSPVIDARVYAVSGNVTYSSTPTDKLGNYSITNLLPGIYRVWAESENYARSKMETVSVTAAATSTVNFVLSSAVSRVEVPDVQGMSLSQALTVISKAGLQTGIILDTHHNMIDPTSSGAASLVVINQSLGPGDPVPVGTVINLFMAVHEEVAIPPTILDIKPNVGAVGNKVELIGIGFGSEQGTVTFSGVTAANITDWKSNSIKVIVPDNVVSGNVQVIDDEGVKSNTFNFTVKDSGCNVNCTIGCTSGCTTGCTSSCTTKIVSCFYKIEAGGMCLQKTEAGGMYSHPFNTGAGMPFIPIDMGMKIIPEDTTLPVSGTIKEGTVRVEAGKAIIPSGTKVALETADGKEVKGSSLSSTGMGIQPFEIMVEVLSADKKTTKTYGGTLVSAEGSFKRDEGITIKKGTEASIMVAGNVYTGKVAENAIIGTDKIDMGKISPGITRLTQ